MHTQRGRPDIDFEDLEEGPRRVRESRFKPVVIGLVSVVCLLALIVVLIRGSMPEMTPEQIVQMKGYEGQQAARHIFNLDSLKQQKERELTNLVSDPDTSANRDASEKSVPPAESVSLAGAVTPQSVIEPATEKPAIVPPAAPKVVAASTEQSAPVVAVTATAVKGKSPTLYEKAELTRDPGIRFIGRIDAVSKNKATEGQAAQIEVLPVLTVKGDQSLLRSGPSQQNTVLKTLSKGDTITIFNYDGDWAYVGTNDGSSVIGYMHSSLLEAAPANK